MNFTGFHGSNFNIIFTDTVRKMMPFLRYTEGGATLKTSFITLSFLLMAFSISAKNLPENKENTLTPKEAKNAFTAFTFDCNNPTITGTFYASGVSQLGFITLRINNVTSGSTNIFVTGNNGFSGGILSTPLTATQTSVQIPISFNGSAGVGSYALTISSPDATNTCNVTVTVVPCTNFRPTITTNAPTILCTGDSVNLTATSGSREHTV
jgi:hypothetical protein